MNNENKLWLSCTKKTTKALSIAVPKQILSAYMQCNESDQNIFVTKLSRPKHISAFRSVLVMGGGLCKVITCQTRLKLSMVELWVSWCSKNKDVFIVKKH